MIHVYICTLSLHCLGMPTYTLLHLEYVSTNSVYTTTDHNINTSMHVCGTLCKYSPLYVTWRKYAIIKVYFMSPNYYIHVTRSFAMIMCFKRLPSCVRYLEIVLRWLYIIRSAQLNQGILMLTYLGLWIDWTTYVTRL